MKNLNFLIMGVAVSMLVSNFVYGQQNSNPISGVINATGSVIKELQDELTKRQAQTHFQAADYKAWNLKFRTQLDQATAIYAGRIATEIIPALKELSDRYNSILIDPSIREDQRTLLLAPVCTQLGVVGNSLMAKYQDAYWELLQNTFGWLPYVRYISHDKRKPGAFLLNRGAESNSWFKLDFQVLRISGLGGILAQGRFKGYSNGDGADSVIEFIDKELSPKTKKIQVKEDSFFQTQFFNPEIHKDCSSQVCLALKAADLELALDTLFHKLDVPFKVEGECVNIKNVNLPVQYDETLLKTAISDPSLPFDIGN